MDLVLALDQGSSSSRALAFDSKGNVVARAQVPVKTRYPRPGWVEHDALDLMRTQERALDSVLAKLPRKANILGLGLASQRSTIVFWDRRTGRPAAAAPSWQDGRASELMAGFQGPLESVHERTGLYLTPYYSAPKIRYVLEHEPKVRALADRGRLLIGPVSTYFLWSLTKGEVFAADPTMAQRTLLFNIRNNDWDMELLTMFGVPRESLPRIVPTTGVWGVLSRGGRKLEVLAVLGDQQAAAWGLGARSPGIGVLNYGTGAFFLLNTGEEPKSVPGLLTSVAWQRSDRLSYFSEGTVHAAGTSFEWLKNFKLLRDVRQVSALCVKATHRVWALQAIGGLGAPRWDYRTPTAYFGLTARSGPPELVRAVTEGIAFLISDIVCAMRDAGLKIEEMRVSGGLAQLDYLLRFQADILQQPIIRSKESEATALGAAALAAEEAQAPWAGALCRGAKDAEFKPKILPEDAVKLLKAWRLFVSAQQKLAAELRLVGQA